MTKLTQEQQDRIAALTADRDAAKAVLDAARTPENMDAYKAAWNALAAYTSAVAPIKSRGMQRSNQAGQRQWKAMQEAVAENRRAAARKAARKAQ